MHMTSTRVITELGLTSTQLLITVFGETTYYFLNLSTHSVGIIDATVLFTPYRGDGGTLSLVRVSTIALNFFRFGIDLSVLGVP